MRPSTLSLPSRLLPFFFLRQTGTGCAAIVRTSIQTTRIPTLPPDSVRVYGITNSVPDRAEILEKATVTGNDLTASYRHKNILLRAKKCAASAGGNSLTRYKYEKAGRCNASGMSLDAGISIYFFNKQSS